MDKLLSVAEVAQILGVKQATLHHWKCTKRNLQPSVKVGRYLRYYEADVLSFLETCRIKPIPAEGAEEKDSGAERADMP